MAMPKAYAHRYIPRVRLTYVDFGEALLLAGAVAKQLPPGVRMTDAELREALWPMVLAEQRHDGRKERQRVMLWINAIRARLYALGQALDDPRFAALIDRKTAHSMSLGVVARAAVDARLVYRDGVAHFEIADLVAQMRRHDAKEVRTGLNARPKKGGGDE